MRPQVSVANRAAGRSDERARLEGAGERTALSEIDARPRDRAAAVRVLAANAVDAALTIEPPEVVQVNPGSVDGSSGYDCVSAEIPFLRIDPVIQRHCPAMLWVVAVLAAVAGCAGTRPETAAPGLPAGPVRGVVFAVDGAGGFHATSDSLRQVIAEQGLPLWVDAVDWTHGHYRVLADQVDCGHARSEGLRLAERVASVRRACPTAAVYLVAHSAGSLVVLTAVESLPPDSVERIILLAPSVSACYDVRPALRNTRAGMDVFFSSRDLGYLGVGVGLVGTSDRRWLCPAAGRTGFRVPEGPAGDAALYSKLRQHAWDPSVAWTGNRGGHYDGYQPAFLRLYVVPLLAGPGAPY